MKEHTTHYACDCVWNRVRDLENYLRKALVDMRRFHDPLFYENAWLLLKDRGFYDGSIRVQKPRTKKSKKR